MNFLEVMLGEKLRNQDSALEIRGSDRKVLQVACQDFTNFLKFHWDLIGRESNECDLVEKLEKLYKENSGELDEFLNIWVGIWLKKWKQRVKLMIGSQNSFRWNRASQNMHDVNPIWKKIDSKKEMQEIVVATLIKNGEICGTEILSENLLKMAINEKKLKSKEDKEGLFAAINATLRKARDMAQSRGPLIFVKIDKGYYSSKR
ncbi:hypothetical protein E2P47_02560 [Candidatus Bathyarchaeota archaeon]|nr:hypothetical protein E2P47_02560 [Candidatus Bathyarchaeota archaeon]